MNANAAGLQLEILSSALRAKATADETLAQDARGYRRCMEDLDGERTVAPKFTDPSDH